MSEQEKKSHCSNCKWEYFEGFKCANPITVTALGIVFQNLGFEAWNDLVEYYKKFGCSEFKPERKDM